MMAERDRALTDLLPTRKRTRVTPGARWGVVVAVTTTLVVIAVHLHTTPPGSRLSVRRIVAADIAVVNPATVAVAVRVDNVGTDPVLPTCLVQAEDSSGRHHGSGVFSVRDRSSRARPPRSQLAWRSSGWVRSR